MLVAILGAVIVTMVFLFIFKQRKKKNEGEHNHIIGVLYCLQNTSKVNNIIMSLYIYTQESIVRSLSLYTQ